MALLLAVLSSGLLQAAPAYATTDGIPDEPKKVFVCKYVGTPDVNERLKAGKNPISVSISSIENFAGIGSFFADAQGRSYVIEFDTGQTALPLDGGDDL